MLELISKNSSGLFSPNSVANAGAEFSYNEDECIIFLHIFKDMKKF